MTTWVERAVGELQGKARWRGYRARVRVLPTAHRRAVDALQRYLLQAGAVRDGSELVSMHERLVQGFEGAASAGTPVAAVVGPDPVAYADRLLGRRAGEPWEAGARRRLVRGLARIAARQARR